MYNKEALYNYLVESLNNAKLKYVVHSFPSGCHMIDIWKENKFHVIQLDHDFVAFSTIDDANPAFTTTPDERYGDESEFKLFFNTLLIH